VGGAEVAIKEITNRINPQDIKFHLVTLRFDSSLPKMEKIDNVLVHRVGFGGVYISKILYVPLAVLKAKSLDKTEKYDGFWAMMTYMLFPVSLLRLFGLKKPYVLTLQDGDPFTRVFNRLRIRIFSPLLNTGFRNASIVQCISNHLASWAQEKQVTCPIEVIPNGVDIEHFSDNTKAQGGTGLVFSQQHKEEGDVWLVSTSRLVHKNAYDDVIHALTYLSKHVKFLIVGQGEDEQKLKSLVVEKGLTERVVFYGHADYSDIPSFLHECDIFIRPSRTEGMGNSFIEAMAVGMPVIATQEGGIADFLFDEERNPDKPATGWAVDKDSPKQIAKAIQDIENNPQKVEKVLANAKEFIKGRYEWNTIAREMQSSVFSKI
jgi:glycosyltransferase involved in cell wall biosynthesis